MTPGGYIFEWDESKAATAVCVIVILMQVLNPLIIFFAIYCVSIVREVNINHEDDDELEDLSRKYQTSLDIFRENHPGPEEEYDPVTASQFSKIHNDYQRRTNEMRERREARKEKSKATAKLSRIYSLYAYVTFWIFVLYLILVCTTRLFGGVVFICLAIIAAIFILVNYIVVLIEYFKWCGERKYIGNLSSSVFAGVRIQAIRSTQPFLHRRAECYHYETRTRTVTTYINGNLSTREETYKEKVVTNLFLEPVSFQYWRDTSPAEVAGINAKGITKIKMTLSVEPGDEETRIQFDNQYKAFHDAYEHMDVHVDFSLEKEVEGFEKRLAAYTDKGEKPAWVSSAFFMLATFLCLSWPYRWAFNAITSKTEFTVSKLVYLSRPAEEENSLSVVIVCITTGNDNSGGANFNKDSSAAVTMDIDQAPPSYEDTIYANATFDASCREINNVFS